MDCAVCFAQACALCSTSSADGLACNPDPATWPGRGCYKPPVSGPAVCATPRCGKPASCIGAYEQNDAPEAYACDDCCGHGNEDGHCRPVSEVTDDSR